MASNNSLPRALRKFALVAVAAAGMAAASIGAHVQPPAEEAWLLDAAMWRQEVAAGRNWPADGWYRLELRHQSVEVSAVRPGDGALVASDTLYLRLPGAALPQGTRAGYRNGAALERPRLGQDHELTLGQARFSLRVASEAKGMQYAIGYGGETYLYILGPFDAVHTGVRAIADLDGDALPDFVVDVEDATYLLLSTRARPGFNRPSAELWARHAGR